MIPYMVGKLAPNSTHSTRGLVKHVPGRGYFRAVSSQNGDKLLHPRPPPQSLNRSTAEIARILAEALAPPQTIPNRRRHQVAHKHSIVELSDGCYHPRWYSDASEYLSQEGVGNGFVRLLEIYEAHEEKYPCLPSNFLQPVNHKHHVRGRAVRSKPALLLR